MKSSEGKGPKLDRDKVYKCLKSLADPVRTRVYLHRIRNVCVSL
jgi:hypothetical protein